MIVAACRGSREASGPPYLVKVWEAEARLEVWESPEFEWGIAEVQFAPGGRSLAVSLDDATTVLFDIPVRPISINPAWVTSTAVGIAGDIRANGTFDQMPILADALQDAGCDDGDILGICRGPISPLRAGWVLDLVLGQPGPQSAKKS
jgi:hypothetical protein